MHNTNDAITIDALLSMVEAKFDRPYAATATLLGWNVETETAEVRLTFTCNGVPAPDQSMTVYAQAVFFAGAMGAAMGAHPYTSRQSERYYVPVTAR